MSTSATTEPIDTQVDVLIVGAGPSGLFCANGLAKAGINVRIVDKRPEKVAAGQADGIQPRTIEVLQSYGLAQRLLNEANQMHMAAFYNPGPNGDIELSERAPDVSFETARYPFECTLHQGSIESIFLDSMSQEGLHVERPVEPVSVDISKDDKVLKDVNAYPFSVTLLNTQTNTTSRVHAKFLIGCDGAHSSIRKSLGFSMIGQQTPFVWGVVDIVPDTDFPDFRCKSVIHSNHGSLMFIPREGDRVRIYIQLDNQAVVQEGGDRSERLREVIEPAKLLEVAAKILKPYTLKVVGDVHWSTNYAIGQRIASQFSLAERAFIAGDACHTHSPKAGQGMNASMNDTHNLIWKLALVLRGKADVSLLKTYESERRKYAQDLINFDKEFSHYFSGRPRTEENQDGISHEDFYKAFQTFGEFTSGIGIHYAPSIIVNPSNQGHATNLSIGKRVPPHTFIQSADGRPIELQDLIVSNIRFKLLFFLGGVNDRMQKRRIEVMARGFGFLKDGDDSKVYEGLYDIVSICSAKKFERPPITELPEILRPHWSRVLLDDTDISGRLGGGGYEKLGIHPTGALVVARPDGYIGMISSLEDAADNVGRYFKGFLKVCGRQ